MILHFEIQVYSSVSGLSYDFLHSAVGIDDFQLGPVGVITHHGHCTDDVSQYKLSFDDHLFSCIEDFILPFSIGVDKLSFSFLSAEVSVLV